MTNIFEKYIKNISEKATHEETSEYGYRTDFENLLKVLFEEINVKRIDHDAKAFKGSKPDYIIRKNDVPILYIETKDLGTSLDRVEKSEQMARYYGYANLVLTDYVEFRFYRNGEGYEKPIKIAEYNKKSKEIKPNPENYEYLAKTLLDFTLSHKEPIKSGLHLSKIMGGKAQRIRDNILQLFAEEEKNNEELKKVYETIKKLLVHDLKPQDFADMYAQTLVYGLFVARFHDETPKSFSREEARDLIPASNPFLRHFFDHIAGPNFNKRLEYIVNELCEVFSHADVEKLMKDYYKKDLLGDTQKGPDPVIHFYEDFLKEYDPKLRKKMGAYYTPLPVVQFIVRSVDHILKKEFKLSGGLADTSKLDDKTHKVQILDPAVGTGTFISAVIGQIYKKLLRSGQKGRWHKYVHNDLLLRLHGFELMMAPYTIAHLKLSMAFKETGFKYFNRRLGIYLTNSLEDTEMQKDMFAFGFAESIAKESKEAAKIKKDTPIMVVLGNPPYSVSSQNKGPWITDLIKAYKENLNERNIQPLSDDYIKFIRFAEHFIEKNGTGVVAMITNNSFIDGIIHRQMRKHLLETFDDIFVLDLHGNSKKKETAPDGGKDENVFDIQQGVAISIFVRKSEEKEGLGTVYHADLYGKREKKFDFLNKNDMGKIEWKKLKNRDPHYFFVPKDFELIEEYEKGFKVDELFGEYTSGVKTHNDRELVNYTSFDTRFSQRYSYKPFDSRFINYDTQKVVRHRLSVMKYMLEDANVAFLLMRKLVNTDELTTVFVTESLSDINFYGFQTYHFPLYLYSEDGSKIPNLDQKIVDKIEESVGKVRPEEIFDYIYAILHSPTYRERYKEFLKIDFPTVPYPKDKKIFNKLVKIGAQLRELHLMESVKLDKLITTYPESGSDTVEKIEYKDGPSTDSTSSQRAGSGRVYINEGQYFGKVPEIAWEFYIGGYQPAQKWLKDRKDRTLTNEEIEHYQKIIATLVETDKLMKKIDEVVPKWPMK